MKISTAHNQYLAAGEELRDEGLPLGAQSLQRKESWRCALAAAPRILRTDRTNGVPRSNPAKSSSKRRRCGTSKGCARTRKSGGLLGTVARPEGGVAARVVV